MTPETEQTYRFHLESELEELGAQIQKIKNRMDLIGIMQKESGATEEHALEGQRLKHELFKLEEEFKKTKADLDRFKI